MCLTAHRPHGVRPVIIAGMWKKHRDAAQAHCLPGFPIGESAQVEGGQAYVESCLLIDDDVTPIRSLAVSPCSTPGSVIGWVPCVSFRTIMGQGWWNAGWGVALFVTTSGEVVAVDGLALLR
ncbi:MAG: hypothetical protein GY832_01825 [Chloroflexi bacterium]|nr:hypothetical protein [Chloroflexota bacterium]